VSLNLDLDHRGKSVTGIVSEPIDDFVVGVEVKSKPWILPLVDTPSGPPKVSRCRDRHIIRTAEHVVVVDVVAKVHVHPRLVTMNQVLQSVRETMDEEAPDAKHLDGYKTGIEALAKRLVRRLRRRGVTIQ